MQVDCTVDCTKVFFGTQIEALKDSAISIHIMIKKTCDMGP